MEKRFQNALFLFRRDLRLEDNTGLLFALKNAHHVIPAFIFTPTQIEKNPYRSDHCLEFMIESLEDLENQLKKHGGKLFLFAGEPEEILNQFIKAKSIDALIVNKDYTPYSQKRDQSLQKKCKEENIPFYSFDDALLHPPEETLKQDGTPYLVFTPYFRNASTLSVPSPAHNRFSNYWDKKISFAENDSFLSHIKPKTNKLFRGGRTEALKLLKKVSELDAYQTKRDFPAEDFSSHLSAALKFTLCSPREVYATIQKELGVNHPLIRSLYWRDFFTQIAYFFPHVFQKAFRLQYTEIAWSNNRTHFQKWCEGKTGFPIVDAGMRELRATGFMHNRVRMIAASFLIKDLHIDWRWGEKYFAQTLIDYDPCVNNGNWQWVAGTGCDAQPYFRVFNPWLQQKKFDPDCLYIKQWIPEIRDLPIKEIHNSNRTDHSSLYPLPMLSHEKAAREAVAIYKNLDT